MYVPESQSFRDFSAFLTIFGECRQKYYFSGISFFATLWKLVSIKQQNVWKLNDKQNENINSVLEMSLS